jgi:predicted glycoside hydrolase/deacetylase ChbG (UPF0249 family)
MIRLIIHSDDFGLHPCINRAIVDVARSGVLTSASWMANGSAADEALQAAASIPGLGVGVHLNIVRGRPLSDPAEVPSLVDSKGRFFNSVGVLLWKSFLGQLRDEDIYLEYRRQVERMLRSGMAPTHFDGEKHTHLLLPGSRRAVEKLCREFEVKKVRTISEQRLHALLAGAGVRLNGSPAQRLKLTLLEHATRRARLCWKNVKTPDLFLGVLFSGRLTADEGQKTLGAILSLKMSAAVEWMFHLGYGDCPYDGSFSEEFGAFFLRDARIRETEFLLTGGVREKIAETPGALISYREL